MPKTVHYGGQAIIEGVMMRGQKNLAIAVRRPNGELKLITRRLPTAYTGTVRKIPFLRGVLVLAETLVIGIQALFQSANISLEQDGKEEEIPGPILWLTLLGSIALSVALFFLAPLFLTDLIYPHPESSLVSNLIEGFIRIGVFIIYIMAMNLIPDIRRVFAYHGAEHKTVNAYENGAPLEPEAVQKYSTAHLRCGTSFLLVVLVVSIIAFALVGDPAMWIRILSRVVLIPVIAAISYEVVQFGAAHADNRFIRTMLTPGLALQAMTTRQPDDTQVEAAISALQGVIEADKAQESN